MPKIFKSIEDAINHTSIKCYVSGDHIEYIPQYYKDFPEQAPLFSNPSGWYRTTMSIAEMITREERGECFTIVNKEDIPIMIKYLATYIKTIERMIGMMDEEEPAVKFFYRAKRFYEKLLVLEEKGFTALNKKHNVEIKKEGARSPSEIIGDLFG